MTDQTPSVKVSLNKIYEDVEATKDTVSVMSTKLDQLIALNKRLDTHSGRIRSVEKQVSAQWVIHGLIVIGIGSMVGKIF